AGAPLVVAVGGDGTLNEVVNGVRAVGGRMAVGAVLTGRGRDACRNFGVPRDPAAAVRALVDGRDRSFDLGRAEWADGRRRWFTIAAGAGFDAAVARRAQSVRARGTLPSRRTVTARVAVHRARRVAIRGPVPLPMHLDGEPVDATPVVLTVEPGALRLRVPRGA